MKKLEELQPKISVEMLPEESDSKGTPVFVRYSFGRESHLFPTLVVVDPEQWSSKKNEVKQPVPAGTPELDRHAKLVVNVRNRKIAVVKEFIEEIADNLRGKNAVPTVVKVCQKFYNSRSAELLHLRKVAAVDHLKMQHLRLTPMSEKMR